MTPTDLPNLFDIGLEAFIVDLDGVVTRTARVHAKAWKQLFDEYLAGRAEHKGGEFREFALPDDYIAYVDGRSRYDGVKAFLDSRGIDLPYGAPTDAPDVETVCGLGNRKNALFDRVVREDGVEVFDTTVKLLRALRAAGVRTACVSSSKNCKPILEIAGLMDLFDVIVDGIYIETHGLPGKPNPDPYVRGAELLEVDPKSAAVVEDAVSGVQSGSAGGFNLVIGVDRGAGREALLSNGADIVIGDLGEFKLPRGRR